MSYLLDNRRRHKRKKFFVGAVIALFVILILIGGNLILRNAGRTGERVGYPFWKFGEWTRGGFKNVGAYFSSRRALMKENEALKNEIIQLDIRLADREAILRENVELKEILGRKAEKNLVLAPIISSPDKSLYDTMIIDIEGVQGIQPEQKVYAGGNVLIGTVAEVNEKTAKVILFSSGGQQLKGLIGEGNIPIDLVGKGGGNFELRLPRDVAISPGTEIIIPSISTEVIAVVSEAISDPRDPFQRVLAASPVNIFELRWVGVRKN